MLLDRDGSWAERVVRELTLDEKASLTAGFDLWHTTPVARVGIPSWRLTDGPSGARGPAFDGGMPSTAVPCGSALGATWDPDLLEEVGRVVGQQARAKSARVLLAPTVNLHRSPLGGRTFESYSEDPLLAGRLAAAFVRGAQSAGVACTVKHLAGNEAEFERFTIDSVVDERCLRELYLLPFEIAISEGGALAVMTAYNRLNGVWCSEHEELLGILRGEWGFTGFTVSDWYACTSTVSSTEAGLDLEMPGPPRQLGPEVAEAIRAGRLDESALDAQVRHLLGVFEQLGALDDPPEPGPDVAVDVPEHRAIARRASAASIVLLSNNGVLPLEVTELRTLAVIGPNADRAQITGGGSATLVPNHRTSPLDALRRRLGGAISITHEPGCDIDKVIPPLPIPLEQVVFSSGEEVLRRTIVGTELLFFGPPAPQLLGTWTAVATGTLVPEADGLHEIAFVQAGRARVLIDDVCVLDGVTDPPPPGTGWFGMASEQRTTTVQLHEGRETTLTIELSNDAAPLIVGVTVGIRPSPPADLLDRAVAAAAGADAVVLIVGTNDDWESESHDRLTMGLPGDQDELVRRVCAANARTAVILNAGSPVALPWADEAPALLDMWFGGQEMADALVDVLTGDVEPSGRLPTSFPERLEHSASFGSFPGQHGEVRYGESLLMGYRWHDTRCLPAMFPFGHGLSYTRFELGVPEVVGDTPLVIRVPVRNVGSRPGSEVVQLYVEPVNPPVPRPRKELKAFGKVRLEAGEARIVELRLDERAFAYWRPHGDDYAAVRRRAAASAGHQDPAAALEPAGWVVEPGTYRLHIGRSSADIAHVVTVQR